MLCDEVKERLNFFVEKNCMIHLKLDNEFFYNGYFVEWETENVFIFNDRIKGLIHIFTDRVLEIEEFRGVRNG